MTSGEPYEAVLMDGAWVRMTHQIENYILFWSYVVTTCMYRFRLGTWFIVSKRELFFFFWKEALFYLNPIEDGLVKLELSSMSWTHPALLVGTSWIMKFFLTYSETGCIRINLPLIYSAPPSCVNLILFFGTWAICQYYECMVIVLDGFVEVNVHSYSTPEQL